VGGDGDGDGHNAFKKTVRPRPWVVTVTATATTLSKSRPAAAVGGEGDGDGYNAFPILITHMYYPCVLPICSIYTRMHFPYAIGMRIIFMPHVHYP